jgi:hypothetical protein
MRQSVTIMKKFWSYAIWKSTHFSIFPSIALDKIKFFNIFTFLNYSHGMAILCLG